MVILPILWQSLISRRESGHSGGSSLMLIWGYFVETSIFETSFEWYSSSSVGLWEIYEFSLIGFIRTRFSKGLSFSSSLACILELFSGYRFEVLRLTWIAQLPTALLSWVGGWLGRLYIMGDWHEYLGEHKGELQVASRMSHKSKSDFSQRPGCMNFA